MSLPEDYLKYPLRRHGMDHKLYPWSNMFERKKITWPGGARVALWITVGVEFFPLTPNDQPFRAPGHMVTPFPDLRTFTSRDYGNRVGIFRIMRLLDEFGLKASACLNAAAAERYPALTAQILEREWEIVAHGLDMNQIHHGGMPEEMEAGMIARALESLTRTTGTAPVGWLSPARSESHLTPTLLARAGLTYVCDWMNDELPFEMNTDAGPLFAMPHSYELEDRHILLTLGQNEEKYVEQIADAFERLHDEAGKGGGRILHLALTPYVIGQPFRIHALARALQHIIDRGAIWNATGADILAVWRRAQ